MSYKTIDLCAGIGGIRRGFELVGNFENVLSAEIDKYACATYEHLFSENAYNDLTTNSFKQLVRKTSFDVLLAGFPCQTFSRAGLKEGFENQEKGIIFFHIEEIIKQNRPKVIFLENVDHLLTHNKGNTFREIINELENVLNYKVIGVDVDNNGSLIYHPKNFIRNSKNFGVPQNRPRIYIVGFDRTHYGREALSKLPNSLPEEATYPLYNSLNEVLEMNAEPKYYMSSGYFETLIKHKDRQESQGNGFGYRIVNSTNIEKPIANTLLATGGSGKERNLVIDLQDRIPGMVIPTKKTPLNDMCIRFMTPREWGKLQGFVSYAFMKGDTDEFGFPAGITDSQKYKQFGNSVTIPVIKEIAEFVNSCLQQLDN